jgi:hypothetical protein
MNRTAGDLNTLGAGPGVAVQSVDSDRLHPAIWLNSDGVGLTGNGGVPRLKDAYSLLTLTFGDTVQEFNEGWSHLPKSSTA